MFQCCAVDTELIRFRIDADTGQQAEATCAAAGLELRDVLRAVVGRIARDRVVPDDALTAVKDEILSRPFTTYEGQLWSTLKPTVDAENAVLVLARFIADCSARLEALPSEPPSTTRAAELGRAREEARSARSELDVSKPDAVQRVLDRFGPLVRDADAQ